MFQSVCVCFMGDISQTSGLDHAASVQHPHHVPTHLHRASMRGATHPQQHEHNTNTDTLKETEMTAGLSH